jgi:hypothetical protein
MHQLTTYLSCYVMRIPTGYFCHAKNGLQFPTCFITSQVLTMILDQLLCMRTSSPGLPYHGDDQERELMRVLASQSSHEIWCNLCDAYLPDGATRNALYTVQQVIVRAQVRTVQLWKITRDGCLCAQSWIYYGTNHPRSLKIRISRGSVVYIILPEGLYQVVAFKRSWLTAGEGLATNCGEWWYS